MPRGGASYGAAARVAQRVRRRRAGVRVHAVVRRVRRAPVAWHWRGAAG